LLWLRESLKRNSS